MRDISFDLETLGTNPDCMIVSIAAVEFDILTGQIGQKFYVPIDLEHEQEGRVISGKTIKWWMDQSDEARSVFQDTGAKPLGVALYMLDQWFPDWEGLKVWGNGSIFDISILDHAFNYASPWEFWNVRDMRTIVDIASLSGQFDKRQVARAGVHHNALDDAIYQAQVISAAYHSLILRPHVIPEPMIARAEDDDISIANIK